MATHPHPAHRVGPATKLLTALLWALVAVGIFGLTGAAALLMASTPSAWPL
ncbi:hypothetical protein [Comamonas sp. 26]|uniref:hypothetical protein n=1 Tax=Comamonas sp. 26 TaxID=2035201 RepID=UPI0013042DA2|nr:hypothetical protein [Comamonas sp. 26]